MNDHVFSVFNRVKNHLLTQNRKSVYVTSDGTEVCCYRSPDGLMCAIGCLINEEHYTRNLEGYNILHYPVVQALRASGIYFGPPYLTNYAASSRSIARLLQQLQSIHDSKPVETWPEALERLEIEIHKGVYNAEELEA